MNELVDIRDINIDPNLSVAERKAEYLRQIKDPYNFKCGKINIKVGFAENAESLENKIAAFLIQETAIM